MGLKSAALALPCATRWGSHYQALVSLLGFSSAIKFLAVERRQELQDIGESVLGMSSPAPKSWRLQTACLLHRVAVPSEHGPSVGLHCSLCPVGGSQARKLTIDVVDACQDDSCWKEWRSICDELGRILVCPGGPLCRPAAHVSSLRSALLLCSSPSVLWRVTRSAWAACCQSWWACATTSRACWMCQSERSCWHVCAYACSPALVAWPWPLLLGQARPGTVTAAEPLDSSLGCL